MFDLFEYWQLSLPVFCWMLLAWAIWGTFSVAAVASGAWVAVAVARKKEAVKENVRLGLWNFLTTPPKAPSARPQPNGAPEDVVMAEAVE